MDKLHLLEDPHTEYGILRKCFSLPKLSYTMRTVEPRPHQGKLDKAVRKNMERVLGVSMLDHQWLQATLLVAMGGLGLMSVATHAPGAYITSLGASSQIMEEVMGTSKEVRVERLVELINILTGGEEFTAESGLVSAQRF